MGLIKVTLPPMPTNALGAEISSIESTKVLDAVDQTTLCGFIEMLSVITVRANEVFSGILVETKDIVTRFDKLHNRVDTLVAHLPQIDQFFQKTDFETLSHNSRAFYHRKQLETSQMLSPNSRPAAISEVYEKCRRPPALERLDSLNDPPGTSCLKLYSDPDFFVAEWIIEMQKQREAAKVKRKERKKKRGETAIDKKAAATTVKVEAKPVMRARYDPHTGQRIDTPERGPSSAQLVSSNSSSSLVSQPIERGSSQSNLLQPTHPPPQRGTSVQGFTPGTVSPRAQPPTPSGSSGSLTRGQAGAMSTTPRNNSVSSSQPPAVSPRAVPPTPQRAQPSPPSSHAPPSFTHPPPLSHTSPPPPLSHASPPPPLSHPPPHSNLPPPPVTAAPPHMAPRAAAPPPPPAAPAPPPPPAPAPPPPPPAGGGGGGLSLASALAAKGGELKPTEAKAKPVDAQSELLSQIRKGLDLKQTVKTEEQSKPPQVDNSVASILARRIAIADSDDEDDAESDEWSD